MALFFTFGRCLLNQIVFVCCCLPTVLQNLHIIDYSLSQTTLEQVFLSFADKQKNSDLGAALGSAASVAPPGYGAVPPSYGSAPSGYGPLPPGYGPLPPSSIPVARI